jgi:hypothetical protein
LLGSLVVLPFPGLPVPEAMEVGPSLTLGLNNKSLWWHTSRGCTHAPTLFLPSPMHPLPAPVPIHTSLDRTAFFQVSQYTVGKQPNIIASFGWDTHIPTTKDPTGFELGPSVIFCWWPTLCLIDSRQISSDHAETNVVSTA